MTPSRFKLPPELVYGVFSNLACDSTFTTLENSVDSLHHRSSKSDLGSCSLVCRAWHDISRPILFRTLILSFGGRDIESTDNIDGRGMEEEQLRLDSFRAFLETNPAIAKLIQQLKLTLVKRRTLRLYPRMSEERLSQILLLIPSLRILALDDFLCSPTMPRHPSHVLDALLIRLTYGHVDLKPHDILDLLGLFVKVGTIELTLNSTLDFVVPPIENTELPEVSSLSIAYPGMLVEVTPFISAIHPTRGLILLCNLFSFDGTSNDALKSLELERVGFYISPETDAREAISIMSTQAGTLRSLHLSFEIPNSTRLCTPYCMESDRARVKNLTDVIHSAPSAVQDITLELYWMSPRWSLCSGMQTYITGVEDALTHLLERNLRSVIVACRSYPELYRDATIRTHTPMNVQDLASIAQAMFPRLFAAGVLRMIATEEQVKTLACLSTVTRY